MASVEVTRQRDEEALIGNPWPLLVSGLVTIALGALLSSLFKDAAPWLTVLLVSVGAVAVGGAVVVRYDSALVWGLAALGASVGSVGFQEIGWDSAQLLFIVLMAAAGVGALLALLPTTARWIAISALIVLHFGGILTAICSANGTWVAATLWNYFYRPHLQFMYLNNAYHFYSPEPGPAVLMWFCIYYEPNADESKNWRWVKVPDFDKEGHPIRPDGRRLWPNTEYTRRLSMVESINFPEFRDFSGITLVERQQRRAKAGAFRHIPMLDDPDIPEYRAPNEISKIWIEAYVRHVARTYRHEKKPELAVKSVKVYRVTHKIANAKQIADGWDPYDPMMYLPYYEGEYEPDGSPQNNFLVEDGLPDPFLHWLIPILPEHWRERAPFRPGPPEGKRINYVLIHAGVKDEDILP
jgi:hypothetical protein